MRVDFPAPLGPIIPTRLYALLASLITTRNQLQGDCSCSLTICPISLIPCNQNVDVWTSSGFLCFNHDDLELASEAFLKAQTLDPDHTMAWVGQALIATRNDADSCMLFKLAVSLSADFVSQKYHAYCVIAD